jgi:hypothetical protein
MNRPEPPAGGVPIRIKTVADRRKGLKAYEELVRKGQIDNAIVIAELTNGRGMQILAQGLTPEEMMRTLYLATTAVVEADKEHKFLGAQGVVPPSPPPPPPKPEAEKPAAPGTMAWTWQNYMRNVMPPDAPALQVQETRRGFYAGAQGLLGIVMKFLDPDTEPTDADLERFSKVVDELQRFADDVMAGKA